MMTKGWDKDLGEVEVIRVLRSKAALNGYSNLQGVLVMVLTELQRPASVEFLITLTRNNAMEVKEALQRLEQRHRVRYWGEENMFVKVQTKGLSGVSKWAKTAMWEAILQPEKT